MYKVHCCFVVETKVYKEFYYLTDAIKFVDEQRHQGYQVLRAINHVI